MLTLSQHEQRCFLIVSLFCIGQLGVLEKTNGTVSLENGKFELKVKEKNTSASSIGYQSKTISLKDLVALKKIYLKSEIYNVDLNASCYKK